MLELLGALDVQIRLDVNHRLRGEESEGDARFVRELARSLSLEFRCHEVDVPGIIRAEGGNLEQTARRARLEFFLGLIRAGELDRVALGHTRSDQAETVLFRILRGTGTAGLAGIRPATTDGLVRPLIDVSRAEVLEYLGGKGISWREDSSNQDRRVRPQPDPPRPAARTRARVEPGAARRFWPAWPRSHGTRRITGGILSRRLPKAHLIVRPPEVVFRAEWLAWPTRPLPAGGPQRGRAGARRPAPRRYAPYRGCILSLARVCRRPAGGSRSRGWRCGAPSSGFALRLRSTAAGITISRPRCPGGYVRLAAGLEVELELLHAVCDSGYNGKESEQLDWGRIAGDCVYGTGGRVINTDHLGAPIESKSTPCCKTPGFHSGNGGRGRSLAGRTNRLGARDSDRPRSSRPRPRASTI